MGFVRHRDGLDPSGKIVSQSPGSHPPDLRQIDSIALCLDSLWVLETLAEELLGFELWKSRNLFALDSTKEVLEGFIQMSDGLLQGLGVYLPKPRVALLEGWETLDESVRRNRHAKLFVGILFKRQRAVVDVAAGSKVLLQEFLLGLVRVEPYFYRSS